MTTKKYTYVLPNSTIAERTSEHEYKFVVVGKQPKTGYHFKTFGTTWCVFSWHSTRILAEKKLASYSTWHNDNSPTNLSVEEIQ